jgi:hypothetical protein
LIGKLYPALTVIPTGTKGLFPPSFLLCGYVLRPADPPDAADFGSSPFALAKHFASSHLLGAVRGRHQACLGPNFPLPSSRGFWL